jgi:2-iminobutanoate/2-iminopropanoate deaminase
LLIEVSDMSKSVVYSQNAPPPIGPYSQAVRAGELLYCSGQIPIDVTTGELVSGGIEAQTRQVLTNLREVLKAGGAGFEHVVKTTIYLTDLRDFADVNRVYGEFVGTPAPARATVQVSALPKGAAVEIDAVAHIPSPRGAST